MKKSFCVLFAAVLVAAAVTSCKEKVENDKYEVVTLDNDAGESSVILYGKLGPDAEPSLVSDAGFLVSDKKGFAEDDAFVFSTPVSGGEFSSDVDYFGISGKRGETYYYRAYIIMDEQHYTGREKSFKIPTLKVTGISLNYSSYIAVVGDPRLVLKATVVPEEAGDKGVKWASSDSKVASVTQAGVVTFVAKGEADITATTNDGGFEAKCHIKVKAACPDGGVDLGLSVFWAVKSVGGSSVGDYGSYYAWGETKPKTSYTRANYAFGNFTYDDPSRYNASDGKNVLMSGDDAAAVNFKGSWRMPTETDFKELLAGCTYKMTTLYGKNGMLLTSKSNSKTLFLPAAGIWDEGSGLNSLGAHGYYWSASLYSGNNYRQGVMLHFNYTSGAPELKGYARYYGASVIAVSD